MALPIEANTAALAQRIEGLNSLVEGLSKKATFADSAKQLVKGINSVRAEIKQAQKEIKKDKKPITPPEANSNPGEQEILEYAEEKYSSQADLIRKFKEITIFGKLDAIDHQLFIKEWQLKYSKLQQIFVAGSAENLF